VQGPTHFGPFFALGTRTGRIGTPSMAGSKDPAASLDLIHLSAWNVDSATFAMTEFPEVAQRTPIAGHFSQISVEESSK